MKVPAMKKRALITGLRFLAFCGLVTAALLVNHTCERFPVSAVSAAQYPAAQFLQTPDGGMAQYAYAMQGSTSPSATLQALAEWNSYVSSRSQWDLSATLVTRLAAADWNARRAGPPTITPEQMAVAATNLINAKLATMTAAEQQDGFKRMMGEVTPNGGSYGLNADYPYVSASQYPGGTWRVTVSPDAFSARKADFARLAPGMVSSGTNFYPGEAMLVLYSVASGDRGFGTEYVVKLKKWIGNLTGLDMTSRYLYGDNGYAARRPLTVFLTEQSVSQLFSELGF